MKLNYSKKVVDTTGAGDTFAANFLVSLLSGNGVVDSIRFGIAAATIKIGKNGAQSGMPTAEELEAFLSK